MLEAADLRCERGGRVLFERLSFRLGAGEFLRVSGANGSGKTSLLRVLCGLLTPSRGSVRWKGEPVAALREEYARQLVYLGHAPAVKGDLTKKDAMRDEMRKANYKSVRGPYKYGNNHFPIQNFYLLRIATDKDGNFVRVIEKTVFEDHADSYAEQCNMKR